MRLPAVLTLTFAASLACMAEPRPSPTPSKSEIKAKAREVGEMEKQLAEAMAKRDTAFLEKVLADQYFDTYEGDKRGLSKLQSIARCKAGLLRYLAIEKESQVRPQDDLIAVEGVAKLIPNRRDDAVPEEQWVHVRRLWKKTDGRWLLIGQIRRLEGDDGKGEDD